MTGLNSNDDEMTESIRHFTSQRMDFYGMEVVAEKCVEHFSRGQGP